MPVETVERFVHVPLQLLMQALEQASVIQPCVQPTHEVHQHARDTPCSLGIGESSFIINYLPLNLNYMNIAYYII